MAKKIKITNIAPKIKEIKPAKQRTESHLEADVAQEEHSDFSTSSKAETPTLKTDLDALGRPLPPQEEAARAQPIRQESTRSSTYSTSLSSQPQRVYQDPMAAAAERSTGPRQTATLPENSAPRQLHHKAEELSQGSQLRESQFREDRQYYTSPGEQQPKKKRYAWET